MAPKTVSPPAIPKLRPQPESKSAAAVTQNKKAAARPGNAADSSAAIAPIVERLKELSARRGRNKIQLIRDHVELGQELIKLKKEAGHRKWAHYRDQAGFGDTQALLLMKLASKWLATEILTSSQDLGRLPTSVRKLAKLVDLSWDEVKKLIAEQDFDDMHLSEVRDAVEAKKPASGGSRKAGSIADSSDATATDEQAEQEPASEPKSVSKSELAGKQVQANQSEKVNPETHETTKAAVTITHFLNCCHELADLEDDVLEAVTKNPKQQDHVLQVAEDTEQLLAKLISRIGNSPK